MDVDEFIDQWADCQRHLSLMDLYREQDRIIRVLHRLEIQVTRPNKIIHVLERKLEALEFLIEQKYGNTKLVS